MFDKDVLATAQQIFIIFAKLHSFKADIMCKKKHTRDKRKQSDSWSDEETLTLGDSVTKAKSGKIRLSETRRKSVDINSIHENDNDGEVSFTSCGSDKNSKNRRSKREIKLSPKVRRRLLSKSLLRPGQWCPLSSYREGKQKGDNKSVSSTEDGWSANCHKKKTQKMPKGGKILCGWKKEKLKKRRVKSQSFREDPLGRKAILDGSTSDKESAKTRTKAFFSHKNQKKATGTSSPRVKVRQDQNVSPKLLRAFSSESMLWSEASWNRPVNQSLQKVSDKPAKGIQKAALNSDNIPTEKAGLTQTSSSGRKSVPLTKSEPVTDELRVIYTTPDSLTHLQGQVDQTRDILMPIIVNRARGLIDRAMDELHRSINLSAATNQEFLKVGENSGSRPRRLRMTELFSKKSTRRMKSSLPRLPSTQTLTPAVAAAGESAFSLIAPSRNISVRLMNDQVKSDTDTNGTENGNVVNSDVGKIATVSQSELKVIIQEGTMKCGNADDKKTGDSGRKKKLKQWWRFGQNGKNKDNQEDCGKNMRSGEPRDQRESKPKNGCEESTKKRLSWKTLYEIIRPAKAWSITVTSPKSSVNTDTLPFCHNKADKSQFRKETDKTTKKRNECARNKKDTKEDSDRKGKFRQTLAKARKGWKKFNDWLDE